MKVLSIDLDYIMGSVINLYEDIYDDRNPLIRWKRLYDDQSFKESHFYIDNSALIYCYHLFLKLIKKKRGKKAPSVSFGYDNDAILFSIGDYSDIDLISIDHHDCILGCGTNEGLGDGSDDDPKKEYEQVQNDRVNNSNWVSWLHANNKLNSYVWIHNSTSDIKDQFKQNLLGEKYKQYLREDFSFDNYNFDHVFVCLSTKYIPKNHWHYFTMFMMTYDEVIGKDINFITQKKFQHHIKFKKTTNELTDISFAGD